MKVMRRIILAVALTCLPFAASAQGKPAHKDALLYFVRPQNGATIKGGFYPKEPIPQGKSDLHFGADQTEARIKLSPGKHTLQLVLGDADHFPFNPPVLSQKITVTIK